MWSEKWISRGLSGVRWVWRTGLVIFFGMIIGSVGWIGIRSEDFPAAYLEPAPESLQLGLIWPRSDLTIPLTIRNHGSRSLVVRDFETSHGFIFAHPLPHAMPAGEAADFHLRVDLSNVLASTRDREMEPWDEPFELLVRPVTNWGRAPLPWRIRGPSRRPDFRLGDPGHRSGSLSNPRVRDALVVPFRRMWMTSEPANFDRVANIIKRWWPEAQPYVDDFKSEFKKAKGQFPPAGDMGLMGSPDFSISPEDVLGLWLNCRLAHVGERPGRGRFTRAEYERELNTYGEAQFEYLFMTAVLHIGLLFISLAQLAERLLNRCSEHGRQPSIARDNLTSDGRRRTDRNAKRNWP
jgi:hypothetical protein